MNIAIIFLAVLGLCNASTYVLERHTVKTYHVALQNLDDLFQQFVAFIPFDKCIQIVERYKASDVDVKQAYDFLRSDEFEALVKQLDEMQEYKEFVKYLYDSGFDYYKYKNLIRKILDLPPVTPSPLRTYRESGIIQMIEDILATLPVDDIRKWFQEVCLPDPSFQELLARISTPEFKKMVELVTSSQQYGDLRNMLKSQGIDVDQIEEALSNFLNGSRTGPQNLNDLLHQFAAMIPFDKIQAIADDYRANDPDVKQAFEFLMSDEFKGLVDKIKALPEFQEFKQYLIDSGLDYDYWLDIVRKLLGFPTTPVHKHFIRAESGIIRMIKDILAVLPIDDIKNWFYNVCLPDPDFQAFLERIRSPDFLKLVDIVYNSQEYKDITDIMRQQGIDVEAIEKVIDDFLHGQYLRMSRSLSSLLDQFLSMIPVAKIGQIFVDYVMNNDDVKAIITYLKGDEFRALVVKIEALQQFKDFLALIYGYGLDVYNALNIVLEILGLPNVAPAVALRMPSVQSGLTDMIDKMIAVLPLDELDAWYKSTCEPDPEFQDVLAHLRSDDFKVIVKTVMEDPAFKTMRQGLIDLDVDVTKVEAFLHEYFGW